MAEDTKTEKKVAKTGSDTHRATQRGYAIDPDSGVGTLIDEGHMVPPNQPISDEWMEPVKKADRALEAAVQEAQDPLPKDVDYTQMTVSALQAVAAGMGISPGGLSKSDLITAIKAADDPTR